LTTKAVIILLLLATGVLLDGCAGARALRGALKQGTFDVSLPEVKLQVSEYIQTIEIEVGGANIVSASQFLDDWDWELRRDSPALLWWRGTARHFSSGLSNTDSFQHLIRIQSYPDAGGATVTAKIGTSSTDPTGRPDREIFLRESDLVLTEVKSRERY
jgi:hypothetical protein